MDPAKALSANAQVANIHNSIRKMVCTLVPNFSLMYPPMVNPSGCLSLSLLTKNEKMISVKKLPSVNQNRPATPLRYAICADINMAGAHAHAAPTLMAPWNPPISLLATKNPVLSFAYPLTKYVVNANTTAPYKAMSPQPADCGNRGNNVVKSIIFSPLCC